MSKDTLLVGKLKECLQEAVVFLRTLGDFKIPAVVERRRKELLVKLEDAQGDTRREKPPKFEGSPEKEVATPPVVKKTAEQTKPKESEREKTPTSSTRSGSVSSSSAVTSPTRRDSKINSLVSGFETLHATAKKEEEEQTPKKWQVELRKTKKPADFPGEEKEGEQEEGADEEKQEKEETPSEKADQSLQESNELKPNAHDGSTLSLDSTGSNEPEATPKTKKKHKLGGLGGLAKKIRGRDKSPAPSRKEEPTPTAETVENAEEVEQVEAEPEEVEEGVKMKGKLEHKVKTRLQTKYITKDVKLKETTLYIGDKESVSMLGCTVQASGPALELFSHSTQKSYTFKVTEGGDEAKEKWITAIQAAIDEVTPKEEEPTTESNSADTVPSIQVSEPVSPLTTAPEPAANDKDKSSKRRESKQLEVKKPVKTLPTQEVIKGYIYRKKPGITSRWEKTYCVVTHSALYFTDVEGNSEYEQMFQVVAGEAVFSEKDKGHDKNSKSVLIKMGKKTEQLSIDKKEFTNWWTVMQQAYCFGESLELEEEEEDVIPEEPIDEDLYEEVVGPPPVPSSPRPGRPQIPEVPPEDDLIIDEDIYEDTDDFLPQSQASEYQLPVTSVAPQLPDRNPGPQPKLPPRNTPNQPQLPPRNPPVSQPQLPPRNTGPPLPSRGDLPKKPAAAPIPPTNANDEELYDDVVIQEPDEDTYDDVVVGGDEVEDTYDDVTVAPTASEPITEEFYEDMAPGQSSPQEDYVVMEHGNGEDDDDGELYVDVDHDPTPVNVAPPPTAPSPTPKSASPKPSKGSTFARVFAGRKTSAVQTVHSGHVSYRGPKKSKFENKFATIEDTNLLVYKTSSDKKHQEKINLGECALELGSTEAGAGQHALRIIRAGKVHHFSFASKEDEDGWVEVLKKLVKYAPVNLGDQQIYQSTEDHIAETDDQLTFKKGSFIRLISKDDDAMWYGQLGNEAQVFDGKTGKFPAGKVVLADDLYI